MDKNTAFLKEKYPTHNVEGLLDQPRAALIRTLYVSRDVYNEGRALYYTSLSDKFAMTAEILELRVDFMAKPWINRKSMEVGHSSETLGDIEEAIRREEWLEQQRRFEDLKLEREATL